MAIRSRVANHGAIYVGENKIVHHFYGSLSIEELYKGMWKNRTVAVYRHPLVAERMPNSVEQVDFMTLLPPALRARLEAARNNQELPPTAPTPTS